MNPLTKEELIALVASGTAVSDLKEADLRKLVDALSRHHVPRDGSTPTMEELVLTWYPVEAAPFFQN
jgi:hypothetical protein